MSTRSDTRPLGPHGTPFAGGFLAALTLAALAATTDVARAAGPPIPYTATGRPVAVGYPGDQMVLPDGEHLRNQVQILAVESADERIAGRHMLLAHGVKQADGSMALFGTWTGEPGTWGGTAFTPSAGVWDGSWSGTRQADGALTLTLAAHGRGGSLEGWELKGTATRAAGADQDPALPLTLLGRIAPTNGWSAILFADDFEDGKVDPAWRPAPGVDIPIHAAPRLEERDGRLTVHLDPNEEPVVPRSVGLFGIGRRVALEEGQVLELRVDLSGFGGTTSTLRAGGIALYGEISPAQIQGYSLAVQPGYVYTAKIYGRSPSDELWPYNAFPDATAGAYFRSGIGLILSVTRSGAVNAVMRVRALDLNRGGAVLWDSTWVDTPEVDPGPTAAEPDIEGPPYLTFTEAAFLFGVYPPAPRPLDKGLSMSMDNFSLRLYEASPYEFAIERAVLLTPPASVQPYVVEGSPTVDGPWTVLSAPAVEVHGVKHLVVPVSERPGLGVYRIK